METVFGWLGTIPNFLFSLLPHLEIIRSTHMGIKFKKGSEEVVLEPGLHWYWPFVSEIEVIAVKYRTSDLDVQYLETKDNLKVGLAGIVSYDINDVRAAICDCWDYEDVIRDKAQAAIKSVVTSNEKEFFKSDKADRQLTGRLQKELKNFGVKVSRVQLSNFAESDMHALWGVSISSNSD